MKLVYKEPVIDEIQKQEEYLERNDDYDCAEAVVSAKWAVINAQEVEAIPVNWISAYMNKAHGRVRAEIIREMLDAWMEQEAR